MRFEGRSGFERNAGFVAATSWAVGEGLAGWWAEAWLIVGRDTESASLYGGWVLVLFSGAVLAGRAGRAVSWWRAARKTGSRSQRWTVLRVTPAASAASVRFWPATRASRARR